MALSWSAFGCPRLKHVTETPFVWEEPKEREMGSEDFFPPCFFPRIPSGTRGTLSVTSFPLPPPPTRPLHNSRRQLR